MQLYEPESWKLALHFKTVFLKKEISKTIKLFSTSLVPKKMLQICEPQPNTRKELKEKLKWRKLWRSVQWRISWWQTRFNVTLKSRNNSYRKRDKDMKTWQIQYCFNRDLILESSCLLVIVYKHTFLYSKFHLQNYWIQTILLYKLYQIENNI